MAGEPTFLSITVGEWLLAITGLLAVVLTILGTRWLEKGRRADAERDDLKRLRSSLEELAAAHGRLSDALGGYAPGGAAAAEVRAAFAEYDNQTEYYGFLLEHVRVPDLALWKALRLAIPNGLQGPLAAELRGAVGNDAPAPVDWIDRTRGAIAESKGHADAAIAALKNRL